jgi:ABC-type transport system involved in multi-copper enzyme maturation permease subunit
MRHKSLIIAFYTFKELWKSKILLNVFFIGLGMMLVTYVATEFTYGVPERVALNFGLGMLSISSLAISLFLGVGLLSKEIESRTVYMIVSRPVARYSFILGKILGLMGIQAVNVLILSAMTLISTSLLGGKLNSLIFWTIGFTFLESLMLLLVVSLVSLLANNVLTIILSVVLLLLGHSIKETQGITFVKENPVLNGLLEVYHFFLPAFYKLNLKDFVIYEKSLPLPYLGGALAYGLLYSLALTLIIMAIFNKKNLD